MNHKDDVNLWLLSWLGLFRDISFLSNRPIVDFWYGRDGGDPRVGLFLTFTYLSGAARSVPRFMRTNFPESPNLGALTSVLWSPSKCYKTMIKLLGFQAKLLEYFCILTLNWMLDWQFFIKLLGLFNLNL